mgnify:CR=1 FL=1
MKSEKTLNSYKPLIERFSIKKKDTVKTIGAYKTPNVQEWIRRDLSLLLNTKSLYDSVDPTLQQAKQSVLTYGMIDLTAIQNLIKIDKNRLCLHIKRMIEIHEKRIHDIEVSMSNHQDNPQFISITISGNVTIDKKSQHIRFESCIDPHKNKFNVSKGSLL